MSYRYLSSILLLLSITFTVNAHADVRTSLERLIKQSHQRGLFNGNVSIYQAGEPLFEESIGSNDGTKKNNLSLLSTFTLGSISKEFSAVAVMTLHEKGLLDIEQPLSKYLHGLPEWSKKVKVKHLLNYTSGLPRFNFKVIKTSHDIDAQRQQIKKLQFEPGTGYLYSNHNIFLQIKLIEHIVKQPYPTFIERNFFAPVGMNQSSFHSNGEFASTAFSNAGVNDPQMPFPIAVMVNSTTKDMHKWLSALYSERLVAAKSLQVLFSGYSKNVNAALGQGELANGKVVKHRHHGSHFNFESQIYHNAALDLTVVLLTNNKNFKLDELTEAIESIVRGQPYSLPKKSLYLAVRQTAYEAPEQGIKLYFELKQSHPQLYDFDNPNALIRIGYKLLAQKNYQGAIRFFKLSTTQFPRHANAFDSLAQAYYASGNLKAALVNYQASVKLDPDNQNGHRMIAKIKRLNHF